MNELREYYESEIYDQGMPNFEDLEHWQRFKIKFMIAEDVVMAIAEDIIL